MAHPMIKLTARGGGTLPVGGRMLLVNGPIRLIHVNPGKRSLAGIPTMPPVRWSGRAQR
jgi:hypothetical protein